MFWVKMTIASLRALDQHRGSPAALFSGRSKPGRGSRNRM
jgi:hypothetical protein